MPLAYSYLRFSSPQQAAGDSIRRQIEAREKWLADHPDVTLDTSMKLTDMAMSAFKRKDFDHYALGQFKARVDGKLVERGSYLLVENLDRLSREDVEDGLYLLLGLIRNGIVVVQLSPVVTEFRKGDADLSMKLMMAIMELRRGNSESVNKSNRIGKAWKNKQDNAAHKIVTKRLPGWVKCEDGKLVLDKERSALVRRIYQLAIDGAGAATIAKQLNAENVPVMGRAAMRERGWREKELDGKKLKMIPVAWSNVGVNFILTTRAVLGEYAPYRTDRTKETGEPVPNYYPAVIDEKTFYAAQAAMKTRAVVGRGRRGKHVNLFAGIIYDARDGGPITYRHQEPYGILTPSRAMQGLAKTRSFPVEEFEDAILSELAELKASDIEGKNGHKDELATLAGKKEEYEELLKTWEAKMSDVRIADRVAANLAKWTDELAKVNAKIAEAQRKAASPLSEALGGLKTLADLLAKDNSDEMRLKVRAALRQCIESVHCVFVGTTTKRLAAVRVQFRDTKEHRDYLIVLNYVRTGPKERGPVKGEWTVEDARWDKGQDLRDPEHAADLERDLTQLLTDATEKPKRKRA